MLTAAKRVRIRYAMFIALGLLINIVDGSLTRTASGARRQFILAIASSFDMVLVVGGLYYWVLVRARIRTNSSLMIVGLLATVRASFLFPSGNLRMITAGICELGFIGIVTIYVRQVRKTSRETHADPVEAIRATIQTILPLPFAVNALTAELAILHYALFSWSAKPDVPAGTEPFTNYEKTGRADVLRVLPVACAFEMIPVHLLLWRWNPPLAWIATGISAYSLIWLAGLARSFRLRPTLIAPDYIYLRYGLIFQLKVPRPLITCSRRAIADDAQFAVPRGSEPTHYIEFASEMSSKGLFGFEKRLARIALTMDDPPAFERAFRVGVGNA